MQKSKKSFFRLFPQKLSGKELNIVDNKGTVKKIFSRDYVPVKIEEEEKSKWIKNRFGGLEFVP